MCFSKNNDDLGKSPFKHTIKTTTDQPVKTPNRRIPHPQKRLSVNEVTRMLKNNIIVPSNSEYSSAIVLVEKPDGTIRFCIDYRKLNDIKDKR
jgi:hypothetical protein